jgi:arabinose-5-phosphate isomerase
MPKNNIIKDGIKVIEIELKAIENLKNVIDTNFIKAVNTIYNCKGKIIVTGIGKSGNIGRKIAATLSSTGTTALFLHSTEGSHGDLGVVEKNDVILAISNSGETDELSLILPSIKRIGAKLISITSNSSSTLAKYSDIVLNILVKEEACPLGLAPTASTTASLVLGDALAVCLLKKRKFKKEDFALFHPSGSLGKKLLITVANLMHTGPEIPLIFNNDLMKNAIMEISSKRLGVVGVINKSNKLTGIITDGDLRRTIAKYGNQLLDLKVADCMTIAPKTITKDRLAIAALRLMNEMKITSFFIIDDTKKPIGIIHMHDILKTGIN